MIEAGKCYESSCPEFCLCCESCCCPGLAVSASRLTVMDQYNLGSDKCDNRMIRFSNCLQYLSCICWVLAFINDIFYQAARIIDFIADLVFHTVAGCMSAQVAYEMKYQKIHNANHNPTQAVATPYVAPSLEHGKK